MFSATLSGFRPKWTRPEYSRGYRDMTSPREYHDRVPAGPEIRAALKSPITWLAIVSPLLLTAALILLLLRLDSNSAAVLKNHQQIQALSSHGQELKKDVAKLKADLQGIEQ